MIRKRTLAFLGGGAALGAASVALYVSRLRPWLKGWGATPEEIWRPLPGDELVADPRWVFTQAVTIHAPASAVWPWLVQWGYQRAGFYSYDFVDRALGVRGVSSSARILPEFQNLRVGDDVLIAEGMGFKVAELRPHQVLLLAARVDFKTFQPFDLDAPRPQEYIDASWVWVLEERGANTTRLISRSRMDWRYKLSLASLFASGEFLKIGSCVMDRKMLLGIQQRAEG